MKHLNKIPKEYLLLFFVIFLIITFSIYDWQSTSNSENAKIIKQSPSNLKLEKEEADVTASVEYLKEKSDNKEIAFSIALDTHSVNFNSFIFSKDITLEKDQQLLLPLSSNESGSGHHRKAELSFAKVNTPFTIVIRNVSDIKRREFFIEKL